MTLEIYLWCAGGCQAHLTGLHMMWDLKTQAKCTWFSLSAQFKSKNSKLGASLGRLHCIAILLKVVSFNPVTKSYTNSVFFILSWIPWKTGFSAHWHFCPHAFKHAGCSQLNTTKGRNHQPAEIQQDSWQMQPDKGSPNWSPCTRKNNPIKTTTIPDTRVLMGWRDFIAA